MILIDTSVWIQYLKKSDSELSDILKSYLRGNDLFAVSLVFGELLQGVKNKREREIIHVFWDNLPKVSEENLFIKAGNLSNKHKFCAKGVGLIDCAILVTAIENDLAVWTLDKKLQEAIELISAS